MVMAMITVTWASGIGSSPPSHPGYQLNIALAALALVVAFLGSGRFSVDALIERQLTATGTTRPEPAASPTSSELANR
jgi:uncharacterized membrane protein YphA (DoxX/SURF4 family)